MERKMEGFGMPKSVQSVELSSISWFFVITKRNNKSVLKWLSKGIQNLRKCEAWVALGRIFMVFR